MRRGEMRAGSAPPRLRAAQTPSLVSPGLSHAGALWAVNHCLNAHLCSRAN